MNAVHRKNQLSSPKSILPVRMVDANSAVQERSVLLTPSGVVVRCNQPPRVDTVVVLELDLPGQPGLLSLRAVVRQSVDHGCAKGFRAEFTGLDGNTRSAIALHLLGSSFQQSNSDGSRMIGA